MDEFSLYTDYLTLTIPSVRYYHYIKIPVTNGDTKLTLRTEEKRLANLNYQESRDKEQEPIEESNDRDRRSMQPTI